GTGDGESGRRGQREARLGLARCLPGDYAPPGRGCAGRRAARGRGLGAQLHSRSGATRAPVRPRHRASRNVRSEWQVSRVRSRFEIAGEPDPDVGGGLVALQEGLTMRRSISIGGLSIMFALLLALWEVYFFGFAGDHLFGPLEGSLGWFTPDRLGF